MRICDCCFTPGGLTKITQAVYHDGNESDYVWDRGNDAPEFCTECMNLLRQKSWAEMGKRHEVALRRILDQDQTPKPKGA